MDIFSKNTTTKHNRLASLNFGLGLILLFDLELTKLPFVSSSINNPDKVLNVLYVLGVFWLLSWLQSLYSDDVYKKASFVHKDKSNFLALYYINTPFYKKHHLEDNSVFSKNVGFYASREFKFDENEPHGPYKFSNPIDKSIFDAFRKDLHREYFFQKLLFRISKFAHFFLGLVGVVFIILGYFDAWPDCLTSTLSEEP